MRTLVIAGEYPWPENTGSRIRLAMILRGLRRCGPTELFSVVSKFRDDFDPPDESLDLAKVGRVGFDNRPPSALDLVPALLRPGTPIGLPRRDRALVQRAIARFMSGRYDLVWFFGPRPWVTGRPAGVRADRPRPHRPGGREDPGPAVRSLGRPRPARVGRVRRAAATAVSEDEVRRWRRLHRRSSRRTAAVVVSSDLDAERAGACRRRSGWRWSPTAIRPSPIRSDGPTVGTPPTLLFQGLLRYPPNIDAARWLAGEVGPALRAQVPDVEIRLVGDHPPELDDTGRPSPGHGDRSGTRHGDRAGPGRRRRGAGPLRQRHQAQDPRGVRPAGAGGVDDARGRGARGRRTASTC